MEALKKYLEQYRHDERIPLALIGLCGLFFIIYVINWISDFHITSPQSSPVVMTQIPPISSISQWHVFGIYNDNFQNLPETSLALTLEGVMLDLNNARHSYVIVSSPSTPATVYKVGDVLPGGALLSKILQQQIIINAQGTAQSLSLPVDQL